MVFAMRSNARAMRGWVAREQGCLDLDRNGFKRANEAHPVPQAIRTSAAATARE
jgi:hypothetical protein